MNIQDWWTLLGHVAGRGGVGTAIEFWRPVASAPAAIAPLVALGAAIATAFLAGVAISSLAVLIAALMALQFLMVEVLGITIDVTVP